MGFATLYPSYELRTAPTTWPLRDAVVGVAMVRVYGNPGLRPLCLQRGLQRAMGNDDCNGMERKGW